MFADRGTKYLFQTAEEVRRGKQHQGSLTQRSVNPR